ncbi:unnamed protein product [Trifolium pratense]|uniref:Uncharacterized protein n=1 Tax=Trifolium pratense TaxID=57577 RepID=A0ACB0IBM8_TRIPR|nr:unnamed protein product [Trifolium pratense]
MAAAVLHCLRRGHPFLLHYRLCSTTTTTSISSGDSPNFNYLPPSLIPDPTTSNSKHSVLEQFEKKWKQLAWSLVDRYAVDGIILSETSKSRQAFIDDTTKKITAFSALLPTPPHQHTQQEIIILAACEKRNNFNRLARLLNLNDFLVKQDEIAAKLNNYKLTFLAEIISDFPNIRRQTPLSPLPDSDVNREQILLRMKESRSNLNPTSLFHTFQVMCEKLKTFNWLMREKENMSTTLTSLKVDLLFKIFSESVKPPRLLDGWPNKWAELYETWNELKDRLMRLIDNNNNITLMMPLKILSERVNILNRLLTLKEMLLKEDYLSAELTYSRVTSLEDIINSFYDMPPLLDQKELGKWNELNKRLQWLRLTELEDAEVFSIRSNREVLFKKGSRSKSKLQTRTEPPPAGPVYIHWYKPPQSAISKHASLSASRTFPPDPEGNLCYYPDE